MGNGQVKCIEDSMSSALSNQEDRGEKSREVEGKAHGQVRVFCFTSTWSDHRNLERALLSVLTSFIAMSKFCAWCLLATVGMGTPQIHTPILTRH